MSIPINVYERPAPHADTQKLPLAYMVAVMQAAAQGAPVQCTYREYSAWSRIEIPDWNWAQRDYRIDPASRPAQSAPEPFKVGDWVIGIDGGEVPVHGLKVASLVISAQEQTTTTLKVNGRDTDWLANHLRHATLTEIEQACGARGQSTQPNPYFQIGPILMLTYGEGVYTRLTVPTGLLSPEQVRQLMLDQAREQGYILGARIVHPISRSAHWVISRLVTWLPGETCIPAVEALASVGKPFVYAEISVPLSVPLFIHVFPLSRLVLAPPLEPATKVPLTPADLTGGPSLWVRTLDGADRAVLAVYPDGAILVGGIHTFNLSAVMHWQWSSDRVNWKPMYKLAS